MSAEADLLAREAASFVVRLRLFTPARWAAAAPPQPFADPASRADVVHHLAQDLADRLGEAPVRLPRLSSDLALPDQLAVTADDLVRSGPAPAVAAGAVAHLLVHRADLLGEPVPQGLLDVLGEPDEAALRVRAGCG